MGNLVVKQIHEDNPVVSNYYTEFNNSITSTSSLEDNKLYLTFNNFTFEKDQMYHVTFLLVLNHEEPWQQYFEIIIKLENKNTYVSQFITKTKVKKEDNGPLYRVEILFQPLIENLNTVSFEIINTDISFTYMGLYSSKKLYQLTNLFDDNIKIKKFGLLGKSNDSFCINGELLHLPKNGIFEINDSDLEIKSFYKIGNNIYNGIDFIEIKPFTLNYIEEIE